MTHDEERRPAPDDKGLEGEEEGAQAHGAVQEEAEALGADVARRDERVLRTVERERVSAACSLRARVSTPTMRDEVLTQMK